MISRYQYISSGKNGKEHLANSEKALDLGADWIQLRMKNSTYDEFLQTAHILKKKTNEYGATLIINDSPNICKIVAADGIHLGMEDMSVQEAKRVIGEGKIIGKTANTLQNILEHTESGADYVGLGPFRFTETKKKLAPVLGKAGFLKIIEAIRKQEVLTPIIAVGGITLTDVDFLFSIGLHGVAASQRFFAMVQGKACSNKKNSP